MLSTHGNDHTWIGFAELAKGSVVTINQNKLSDRFKTNKEQKHHIFINE